MSVCSAKTFKWSEEQFSLEHLVTDFKHLLPFPILVRSGCSPRNEPKVSPSPGQVYWVHAVIKCKYLIVKNKQGKSFKISESLDAMVIPTKSNGKDGKPFPFSRIRSEVGFKHVRFVDPQPDVINEEMRQINEADLLTRLKVVDTCDEDMLVVHCVLMENFLAPSRGKSDEEPHHKVIPRYFKLLPAYMPISVSIALSLTLAPDIIYFHTMSEITQIVENYEHNYEAAKKDAAEVLVVDSSEAVYANAAAIRGVHAPIYRGPPLYLAENIDPLQRLEQVRTFCRTGDIVGFDTDVNKLERDGYLEPEKWLDVNAQCERRSSTEKTPTSGKKQNTSWLRMRLLRMKQSRKGEQRAKLPTHRASDSILPSKSRPSEGARDKFPHRHSFDSAVDAARPGGKVKGSRHSESSAGPKRHQAPPSGTKLQQVPLSGGDPGRKQDKRIQSMNDVPEDIAELTIDQVTDCLDLLNLSEHAPLMRSKKVDGRLLMCLAEEDLETIFGLSGFNAMRLVQFARCGWRPKIADKAKQPSNSGTKFENDISRSKIAFQRSGRH